MTEVSKIYTKLHMTRVDYISSCVIWVLSGKQNRDKQKSRDTE